MSNNSINRIRLVQRARTRTGIRMMTHQKIILVSSFMSALALALIVFINFYEANITLAAASGDYRSKATGNWNSTSTWETYNGSSWVNASSTPTSADGVITIQSGHTVSITANVTVDQVIVASGGTLTNSAATLTVANGTGSDMDVAGTANLNTGGTVSINSSAVITILNGGTWNYNGGTETVSAGWAVNNGGIYVHNVNGVDVPTGTWGATSTLKVTGVTNTDLDGLNQTLGNFIYDCASQTANIDFKDKLTSIAGDFTVVNTGTGSIKFDKSSTNQTLVVSGNYSQTGGTLKMTNQGNWNVSVTGNFSLSGGTYIMAGADGVPMLTVSGNISISGGTLDMSQYTGNTAAKGVGTINLYGNLSQSGGTLTETATNIGKGEIYFTKTGTQTFVASGGTISNVINVTINSGAILDMGAYIIPGSGSFTVASGGGLCIGSVDGITSSGATGNVQNTGARNFSTGANYTYNGSATQVTGNGLPATVNNFTMNNSSGLTVTNSFIISNLLTLTSGNITTNANVITLGTAQSNTGTLSRTTGHVIGFIKRWFSSSTVNNILFPVGTSTYYEGANVSITSVPSGGTITGSFTDVANSYNGLQLADAGVMIGTVAPGYWTLTQGDGMSGGAFTLDLYANSIGPVTTDYTKTHIIQKTLITDPWIVTGTYAIGTGSNANPVAHRTGLTLWNIFAIGGGVGTPLPVGLSNFDVAPKGNAVICSWQTESEINNDYFTIERSTNGTYFTAVDNVDAAGNSTSTLNYSYEDDGIPKGIIYYRLKQTDFDGHFTYSKIKSVDLRVETATAISISSVNPNPFRENFSITYRVADDSAVNISLMNTKGQVIFSKKQNAVRGTNRFDYNDGQHLVDGIYFATLTLNNQTQIQKIIKN